MWLVCHVQSKAMSIPERFLYQPLSVAPKPVEKKAVGQEEVKNGSLSDEDEGSDTWGNQ